MALTSGGLERSGMGGEQMVILFFASALLNVLSDQVGPISATEIFQRIREPVLKNSLALGAPQTPILQAIPLSDHIDPDVVLLGNYE